MNYFLLVLVEPELADNEPKILARIAEIMAPHDEQALITPHVANCLRENCTERSHVLSRRYSRWDWYVIGGDWDGRIVADEAEDPKATRPWPLKRNMKLVRDLPEDISYHAILTPDGWFDKPEAATEAEEDAVCTRWIVDSTRLLGRYSNYLAVGIHYHL